MHLPLPSQRQRPLQPLPNRSHAHNPPATSMARGPSDLSLGLASALPSAATLRLRLTSKSLRAPLLAQHDVPSSTPDALLRSPAVQQSISIELSPRSDASAHPRAPNALPLTLVPRARSNSSLACPTKHSRQCTLAPATNGMAESPHLPSNPRNPEKKIRDSAPLARGQETSARLHSVTFTFCAAPETGAAFWHRGWLPGKMTRRGWWVICREYLGWLLPR